MAHDNDEMVELRARVNKIKLDETAEECHQKFKRPNKHTACIAWSEHMERDIFSKNTVQAINALRQIINQPDNLKNEEPILNGSAKKTN
jgi:hypothetical protein